MKVIIKKFRDWLTRHARFIQGMSFVGWVLFALEVAGGGITSAWSYFAWIVVLVLMSSGIQTKEEKGQTQEV